MQLEPHRGHVVVAADPRRHRGHLLAAGHHRQRAGRDGGRADHRRGDRRARTAQRRAGGGHRSRQNRRRRRGGVPVPSRIQPGDRPHQAGLVPAYTLRAICLDRSTPATRRGVPRRWPRTARSSQRCAAATSTPSSGSPAASSPTPRRDWSTGSTRSGCGPDASAEPAPPITSLGAHLWATLSPVPTLSPRGGHTALPLRTAPRCRPPLAPSAHDSQTPTSGRRASLRTHSLSVPARSEDRRRARRGARIPGLRHPRTAIESRVGCLTPRDRPRQGVTAQTRALRPRRDASRHGVSDPPTRSCASFRSRGDRVPERRLVLDALFA